MHACDGQTDGRTEFSSLDRVCIACSAVKHTKIQKSKAIASPTQDRALILRKPRAVQFSTCPLNAPVRGRGVRWVHPNILYVNFQHPQQCGEHPHQEMASYGPGCCCRRQVRDNERFACRAAQIYLPGGQAPALLNASHYGIALCHGHCSDCTASVIQSSRA